MRVVCVDSSSLKPRNRPTLIKEVVGIIVTVPSLYENTAAKGLCYGCGSLTHIRFRCDRKPAKNLCLRNVRRNHLGKRNQKIRQCLHRLLLNQSCPAGGNHDRIQHDVLRRIMG